MMATLDQFHGNIARADDLCALYKALRTQTTTVLEISDLLRAAIVIAVSALDHFIHEVVRTGMLDAHKGRIEKTDPYRRFSISLASLENQAINPTESDWLDAEIRARHGWQSFEHPDKIAEALRLVSDRNVWDAVGTTMDSPASDVKATLKLIVDRRNQIAHESDMNPSAPGERWPIDEHLADNAINFIRTVGDSVYHFVMEQYIDFP